MVEMSFGVSNYGKSTARSCVVHAESDGQMWTGRERVSLAGGAWYTFSVWVGPVAARPSVITLWVTCEGVSSNRLHHHFT